MKAWVGIVVTITDCMWEETGFNLYSDKVLAIIQSLWLHDSNMRRKAWITYQHQTKAMVVVV